MKRVGRQGMDFTRCEQFFRLVQGFLPLDLSHDRVPLSRERPTACRADGQQGRYLNDFGQRKFHGWPRISRLRVRVMSGLAWDIASLAPPRNPQPAMKLTLTKEIGKAHV